ncbi:MAG: regulatory protein RecX [Pseudomonadota bacterium]|uniref:regulatory protein RecX n=1 Tax=Rhizorhabdus phycosphaerae TaxID=2711156 RepID=UPI0013EA902A|nr:regulatory protein RecX [Rhizorhabdus phycosphaerae]
MARTPPREARPYDAQTLARAALDYAARYATTRAKLAAYLRRKLKERGWAGEGDPGVDALVARFADHGYVDDLAFADARAQSLLRRGYGARRIAASLRAAGIEADTAESLRDEIDSGAEDAALRFARRRRIGPYADHVPDRDERRRWVAAMARAGHAMDTVMRVLAMDAAELDIDVGDVTSQG